ncbi:MAG: PHB depolymerase family esterase [Trueperaceae bacterium]
MRMRMQPRSVHRSSACGASRLLVVLGLLTVLMLLQAAAAQAEDRDLILGGTVRTYRLFVPESLAPGEPPPLLLALHGRGGTGGSMADLTGFDELARRQGVIVAYPDGLGREWNYLVGVGGNQGVDDVLFLEELVRDVDRLHRIDASRVFVAGFSNGGFMAQRLACQAGSPISAFGVVAAAGFGGMPGLCGQPAPISMLLIHGTADTVVPWGGGTAVVEGREVLLSASAADTFAFWADSTGCSGGASRSDLPQTGRSPGTSVVKLRADSCREGHRVVLYAVLNGGHNWPGSSRAAVAGPVNRDIDATELIWQFFRETASSSGGTPPSD